jgi:hypothetical protein
VPFYTLKKHTQGTEKAHAKRKKHAKARKKHAKHAKTSKSTQKSTQKNTPKHAKARKILRAFLRAFLCFKKARKKARKICVLVLRAKICMSTQNFSVCTFCVLFCSFSGTLFRTERENFPLVKKASFLVERKNWLFRKHLCLIYFSRSETVSQPVPVNE